VSHVRNLIRELKAVARMHTDALLLDADLDFAQPSTHSTPKEANQ
jgi:hypothetical protein